MRLFRKFWLEARRPMREKRRIVLPFGVAYRNRLLRWASLILMLVSVAKVFLFDTRELGGLWRVASYFGLGISLMLVAFVYQRFVFRDARGRVGELP